jgi:hypothetical protein
MGDMSVINVRNTLLVEYADARGFTCNASPVPDYVTSSWVTDTFWDAYRIRRGLPHGRRPEAQHSAPDCSPTRPGLWWAVSEHRRNLVLTS